MPSILLIRHAQASFGAADYDVLSELGHRQTQALVDGLRRRGIVAHRVVSGALRRQRDTAAPCAAALGIEVAVDERFDEYVDRDILEHHAAVPAGLAVRAGDQPMSSREFQELLNVALRQWIEAGAGGPAREPWPRFLERLRAAIDSVATGLGKGETALVISSGGGIAALVASLLRLPPEAMIALNHVSINTGITKLAVGRGGITVISSNEHAHLEEAGGSLVTYR
jgi:broad specificity phosphatase PhoE